jgi:hypothetical protein
VTPTRLFVHRVRADASGRETSFGQTIEVVSLDEKLSTALKSKLSAREEAKVQAAIEALIESRGLDRATLPPDPESRARLGW